MHVHEDTRNDFLWNFPIFLNANNVFVIKIRSQNFLESWYAKASNAINMTHYYHDTFLLCSRGLKSRSIFRMSKGWILRKKKNSAHCKLRHALGDHVTFFHIKSLKVGMPPNGVVLKKNFFVWRNLWTSFKNHQ